MARTRASKGAASAGSTATKASSTPTASAPRYTLSAETSNPPKVFILPSKATADARVVSLHNPRYSKPTRYLACPETGIYEFTRIAAPKSTPRSWLVECRSGKGEEGKAEAAAEATRSQEGFDAYVTKGAELHIATPVDPVFLILPALLSQEKEGGKDGKKLFLSSDDYFDSVPKETSPHFSEVLRWGKIRQLFEARLTAVCETVEAGDESMYRFSMEKLLEEMLSKAQRMSQGSLPPSMEEKFVTKALEAPVLGLKREQSSVSSELADAAAAAAAPPGETADLASALNASMQASADVIHLQRLRTAFAFICSSYVAPTQAAQLKVQLSENKSTLDFSPLDDYLAKLTTLRQEVVASRSMGDFSNKRVLDEEEVMERAEKKRKKDDEDKRQKAGESRGVKNLKKVNVTGMKKMSDFFKKK